MCEINTYIGQEGNGFACVGHTEGLDRPGVIFNELCAYDGSESCRFRQGSAHCTAIVSNCSGVLSIAASK